MDLERHGLGPNDRSARKKRPTSGRPTALGKKVANPNDGYNVATIIDALGAIAAPAAELTPFVLEHAASRAELGAGVRALVAVEAALKPEELDALREKERQLCAFPRHPGAMEGYGETCGHVEGDLTKLEALAPPRPTP